MNQQYLSDCLQDHGLDQSTSLRSALASLLAVFVLITGCASAPQVSDLATALSADYVPTEEEVWAEEQADKFHEELLSKGLIYTNPEIDQYLAQVKDRLLNGDERVKGAIRIYLLRSPVANAMALTNGNIYINSGLFTYLQTEDQLAAVTAHEIAHITERHSVKSLISRKRTMVGAHIADLLTGGLGLAYLPALSSLMQYSREIESEADAKGLRELRAANYNPQAMSELISIFKDLPESKNANYNAYSSHPSQDLRLEQINALIKTNRYPTIQSQKPDLFADIKAQLMKKNIAMCLRSRQFQLALAIVDQAANYYSEAGIVSFYRAEAYMGMLKYPRDAAVEKYWLETGESKPRNDYLEQFIADQEKHARLAEKFYKQAAMAAEPYTLASKRLGELYQRQNQKALALQWYRQYLADNPRAADRRSVERKLKRLSL